MMELFREHRLLRQSAAPERGPEPVVPPEGDAAAAEARSKMTFSPDLAGIDNPFLRLTSMFSQVTQQFQPMFLQYPQPMQQQMWPQMQGVYGGMMGDVQQNYYGMLYNLQSYPAMTGTWPNGVFDTAGMYPYSGQSYAYPTPWTWYAPQGMQPIPGLQAPPGYTPPNAPRGYRPPYARPGYRPPYAPPGYVPPAVPEANPERQLLLQNTRTTLSSLSLRHPQLGVLLNEQAMEVTAQFNGRSRRISLSGQNSGTVAKYLEDQVAAFLRGDPATTPPEGPDDTLSGIPETIALNTPFTLTVRPPTAPLTISVGAGGDARPFIISAAGAITPAGAAPFTATRTAGAVRITITAPGAYAFQSGTQTVRRNVAGRPGGTPPESPEQARFEEMVRAIRLPEGVTVTAITGRDVTLSFDGVDREVTVGSTLTTAALVAPFLTQSSRELQRRRTFRKAWNSATPPRIYWGSYPSYTVFRLTKGGAPPAVDISLATVGTEPDTGEALEQAYRKQIDAAIATLDGAGISPEQVQFEARVRRLAPTALPAGVTITGIVGRMVALDFEGSSRTIRIPESVTEDMETSGMLTIAGRGLQRRRTMAIVRAQVELAGLPPGVGLVWGGGGPEYNDLVVTQLGPPQREERVRFAPVDGQPDVGAAAQVAFRTLLDAAIGRMRAPETGPDPFRAAMGRVALPTGMELSINPTPPRTITLRYKGRTHLVTVNPPDTDAHTRVSAYARSWQEEIDGVPTSPTAGFESFPAAMTIFRTHEFRMTPANALLTFTATIGSETKTYTLQTDGVLKAEGRVVPTATLPFSIGRAGGAVLFTASTPGTFTFQSGANAPARRVVAPEAVRPAAALIGLPPRLIKDRPTMFTTEPSNAPVSVAVTLPGGVKVFTINPDGSVATPDATPVPFAVSRFLGSITITPRTGTSYLIRNSTLEQRLAVVDAVEPPAGFTALPANDTSRNLLRARVERGDEYANNPDRFQRGYLNFVKAAPVRDAKYTLGAVAGADVIAPGDEALAKEINSIAWNGVSHRINNRTVSLGYDGWKIDVDVTGLAPDVARRRVFTASNSLRSDKRLFGLNTLRHTFYQAVDRQFTGATRHSAGGTTIEVFKEAGKSDWETYGFNRTVGGERQKWIFSTFTIRGDDGPSSEVTLRRSDNPNVQVSLKWSDLFTNAMGPASAVNPQVETAMRRAETVAASRSADAARVRNFDLPRDRAIGYIGLFDEKQSMMENDIRNMPRMLAGRGHTFVSSGAPARAVTTDPMGMMEGSIRAMYAGGIRDFYVSIGAHGSSAGYIAFSTATGGRFEVRPADIGRIVDHFPDCRFTFDAIACFTGGLDADANLRSNLYTDLGGGNAGRVTVFIHTKAVVTNMATGAEGDDWSDASSMYTYALLRFLNEKNADGTPKHTYGEAHLLADDLINRTFPGLDAGVIRSGAEGGVRTARDDRRPPLGGLPPRDPLA